MMYSPRQPYRSRFGINRVGCVAAAVLFWLGFYVLIQAVAAGNLLSICLTGTGTGFALLAAGIYLDRWIKE